MAFPRAVRWMNGLLGLSVLFVWGLSPAHGNLLQLHQMISEATGKNALLHYGFYGCYCGLGGRGQPMDATDRCCQLHDACYESLQRYNCDAMAQPYSYSWYYSTVYCDRDSWCSYWSCACDSSLARCLRTNVWSYNEGCRFYPKDRC